MLKSGQEDTVMLDQVLEYHQEPEYMLNMLKYKLTVFIRKAMEREKIAKNELRRRINTSSSQMQRLFDLDNNKKSVDKMIMLAAALGYPIELQNSLESKGAIRKTQEKLFRIE